MTPIPDFDHLPLPAVSHRIRALDLAQLDELMEHEQAHGNRLPVLEVMRSRRRELEEGATPVGRRPGRRAPGDRRDRARLPGRPVLGRRAGAAGPPRPAPGDLGRLRAPRRQETTGRSGVETS